MSLVRVCVAVVSSIVLMAGCSDTDDPHPSSGGASSSSSGGGGDGGVGGMGGGGGQGGVPEPSGPIRYPAGLRHSPLAKSVIEQAKKVLASGAGRKDVFAKVGASNTVNTGFLHCLAGADIKLAEHAALQPTIDYFKKTLADGAKTSFNRTSLAATVGWSSGDLLAGMPSPLEQELSAITPAFAVVLLGTNDTYVQGIEPFGNNMLRIVDTLTTQGVLPLLTTIPQRSDTAEAAAMVPEMNAIVRAVAQARQVPMLDIFGALDGLVDYGLASDGIHLQIYSDGGAHACWLDASGLTEGMNQRNLLTLEALDRARRFLLEDESPEPRPKELDGDGTWQSPYEIDALPFVDDRNTTGGSTSVVDKYSCSMANEGGPEIVYRLVLDAPKNLRLRVIDGTNVDIDVHFMSDPGGADACIARSDKVLDVMAGPGTYWISADTYVDASMNVLEGAYLLTILER